MIVRRAQISDADDLAKLHATAFDYPWSSDDFGVWLAKPQAFGMIVQTDECAAGLAMALAAGSDAELLTIASDPQLRRQGVAQSLLRAIDVEAAQRGLERWVLEVASTNLAARSLYERFKFVEIGVRKGYYSAGSDRIDGIVLARPVGLGALPAGGHDRF